MLREIYVRRQTGLLHLTHAADTRSVRFEQGRLVAADGADPAQGDPAAHAARAREALLAAASWPEGCYDFEELAPAAASPAAVKPRTPEVILETVRIATDAAVRSALGDPDRVLAPGASVQLLSQDIPLTPTDGYVLSRVDGLLTARELVELMPQPPEQTERSLLALLCTGLVEYRSEAPKPKRPKREAPADGAAQAPRGDRAEPERAAREAEKRAREEAERRTREEAERRAKAEAEREEAERQAKATSEARRQEIITAFEGLKTRNHFEILGVTTTTSDADVKKAYFTLARRFHPDALRDTALADLKDKVEAVFIRLGEAYEVLKDPERRGSYEADLKARAPRGPAASPETSQAQGDAPPGEREVMDPRAAELLLRKAEKLLEDGKTWDAIQTLEPAIRSLRGRPRSRARVLLARCYLKNPNWIKRAEEMLQDVVHEDPKCSEAYFTLGGLYKSSGLKTRALHMFRKVVELKPDHQDAAAEVAALTPPPEEPEPPPEGGGGIFKKLFGRG